MHTYQINKRPFDIIIYDLSYQTVSICDKHGYVGHTDESKLAKISIFFNFYSGSSLPHTFDLYI